MTDPFDQRPNGSPAGDSDNEPEIIEGEVVDDAAAGAYRGAAAGSAGFTGRSPFSEPDPFGDPASSPQFGVGGVGGSFAALRAIAGNSAEIREVLTTPLRLLAIVVAVPSVIAALFGLTIDGGARYVAFAIAVLGLIAVVLVELRRRRLATVPPPRRAGDPARPDGVGNLIGLIGFSLLMLMLAIGFDLLALLLVIFAVW
ncbi:hypothetical protein [Nakamurella lactea]|uniref:hypothetical protein n=1 Tax=Nakamurella lactea TaxID=459515 RepID=UPI00040919C0|nr:hypothetical protein [Nakamurella lactea]